MKRVLVSEQLADSGLEAMRAAGLEVDVRLGLSPERAARGGPRRVGAGDPQRHPGHRRGARSGRRARGRRPGRHRARQRRRRGRDPAWRHGRQRARSPTCCRRPSTPSRCCSRRPATCPRPTATSATTSGTAPGGRASSCTTRRSASSASVVSACSSRSVRTRSACSSSAYDPYVSADRARQLGVDLVPTIEELVRARRLPHHPPAEDRPTPSGSSPPSCSRTPSRRCGSSTRPAAGSSTKPRSPTPCATARIAGAALDVFAAGTHHRVAAVRARHRRGHAAPRRVDGGGAGQGGPDDRRAGRARAARRVRAVRGQPRGHGSERDGAAVHAARRAAGPHVHRGGGRHRRHARDLLRRTDRRLRLPGAHAVGAQGRARSGRRRAGVVRERAAARRGARAGRCARPRRRRRATT